MPIRAATRRASSTAESEQQPPCTPASSCPRGHCWSVMPTTSWPCAASSAAVTLESTPPDIATATRTAAMLRTEVRQPSEVEEEKAGRDQQGDRPHQRVAHYPGHGAPAPVVAAHSTRSPSAGST